MSKIKDLTGQVFGRLTVIKRAEDKVLKGSGKKVVMWLCLCSCGNYVVVQGSNLRNKTCKSCGCYHKDVCKSNVKHGQARKRNNTRLYSIWCGIKSRCYNASHQDFKHYGQKGVQMSAEWKENFSCFKEWAMNNGYTDKLTIDRINNNGNYEPSNCRWVTRKVQSYNTSQNHYITYNNKTMTLTEWSRETGIKPTTILNRLERGWTIKRTLTQPTK